MQIIDLDIVEKPGQALADVIRFTGAQPSTLQTVGVLLNGYEVEAKSGARYFIDATTLRTFDAPSGRFICIMQDGQLSFEVARAGQLAARMLALYNDLPSKLWPVEE